MNQGQAPSEKSVVVVGAGGNIGSHLVPHLGRMPCIGCITLIDKDRYERGNVESQNITLSDIGKLKVAVQARKLRRIRPTLHIETISKPVECVPMAKLRSDVIISCLDSRSARQFVNQFAWRLGVPFIDAGVEAGGMLARINVYTPGGDNPCLECAWDERDYDALEQSYPCAEFESQTTPTSAPSSLGALAGSLQAIEALKLFRGHTEIAAIGKQILVDARHQKHYVTEFRRNPECRFSGHEIWNIQRLSASPGAFTLSQALRIGCERTNGDRSGALRIEGKTFVRRLTCPGCGATRVLLRLGCTLQARQSKCGCGRTMITAGVDTLDQLSTDVVPRSALSQTLSSLGLRKGEVFSICYDGQEIHIEIG